MHWRTLRKRLLFTRKGITVSVKKFIGFRSITTYRYVRSLSSVSIGRVTSKNTKYYYHTNLLTRSFPRNPTAMEFFNTKEFVIRSDKLAPKPKGRLCHHLKLALRNRNRFTMNWVNDVCKCQCIFFPVNVLSFAFKKIISPKWRMQLVVVGFVCYSNMAVVLSHH